MGRCASSWTDDMDGFIRPARRTKSGTRPRRSSGPADAGRGVAVRARRRPSRAAQGSGRAGQSREEAPDGRCDGLRLDRAPRVLTCSGPIPAPASVERRPSRSRCHSFEYWGSVVAGRPKETTRARAKAISPPSTTRTAIATARPWRTPRRISTATIGWATTVSTKARRTGPKMGAAAWMPQSAAAVPLHPEHDGEPQRKDTADLGLGHALPPWTSRARHSVTFGG
jgi:hypothetical protein